jgi:two-component system, NarL family, invasion response regulator UvrY
VADEPVSVLIVDDQAPFRSAARAVVAMTSGFAVVGEAASGEEALELVESSEPAVVLMDINMPGINGIETSRRITAGHPQTVVVLLSTYAADELPADARDCGAATYVNKEEFGPDVLEQLRRRLEDGRDA